MEPEMLMNLAWYREEDWPRWLEISDDEMCATYSQWLKGAEKTLLEATRQGTVVHRTEIRPDEFLTWAKLKRIPLNGYARIEFAGERFGFVKRLLKPYKPPAQMPDRKTVYKAMRSHKAAGGDINEVWEPFLRRPKASICPNLTDATIAAFQKARPDVTVSM